MIYEVLNALFLIIVLSVPLSLDVSTFGYTLMVSESDTSFFFIIKKWIIILIIVNMSFNVLCESCRFSSRDRLLLRNFRQGLY